MAVRNTVITKAVRNTVKTKLIMSIAVRETYSMRACRSLYEAVDTISYVNRQ